MNDENNDPNVPFHFNLIEGLAKLNKDKPLLNKQLEKECKEKGVTLRQIETQTVNLKAKIQQGIKMKRDLLKKEQEIYKKEEERAKHQQIVQEVRV